MQPPSHYYYHYQTHPKKYTPSQQPLLLQIVVHLLGHDVALGVLHLDDGAAVVDAVTAAAVLLDLLPEAQGLVDAGDVAEERRVGDAEALEAVDVARLVEVLVEGPPPHVHEVAADLAGELHPQPVQLVQPERDRLPVPR